EAGRLIHEPDATAEAVLEIDLVSLGDGDAVGDDDHRRLHACGSAGCPDQAGSGGGQLASTPKEVRMEIRFWGVRGSVPVPGVSTEGVGGNTSCIEVSAGGERIVLDAGTGLRCLGATLGGGPVQLTLLLSHLHWDHIQGIPFFGPLYRPGRARRRARPRRQGARRRLHRHHVRLRRGDRRGGRDALPRPATAPLARPRPGGRERPLDLRPGAGRRRARAALLETAKARDGHAATVLARGGDRVLVAAADGGAGRPVAGLGVARLVRLAVASVDGVLAAAREAAAAAHVRAREHAVLWG